MQFSSVPYLNSFHPVHHFRAPVGAEPILGCRVISTGAQMDKLSERLTTASQSMVSTRLRQYGSDKIHIFQIVK